jgi:hypothetical protein
MARNVSARLYALPRERFTEERNKLAARFRREGRALEAADVLRLQKPTLGAWALNQLAAHDSRRLTAVFDAGDRMRRALASKPADVVALQSASRARARAVRAAVAAAASHLERAGHVATHTLLGSLDTMLRLASTDPRLQRALTRGRLSSVITEAEVPVVEAVSREQKRRDRIHVRSAARRAPRRRSR